VTVPAQARAGRREWVGLAVIALPCVVYAMDLTVLNLALPALSEDLRPSSSQLLWIVDIYRSQIDGAVPAAVPPRAAEAARDTIGAAVGAGDELPDQLASELVDAAREAFTQALQLAATISAAVAIGAASILIHGGHSSSSQSSRFSPGSPKIRGHSGHPSRSLGVSPDNRENPNTTKEEHK
jgi:hypothetical protein